MSVQQILQEITVLSAKEQNEVAAFLFHLRHRGDTSFQNELESRMGDTNQEHWLTPEEFEQQLEQC